MTTENRKTPSKRDFTCSMCGGTFESERSEQEARAEYENTFGLDFHPETAARVCDGCFEVFMARFKVRDN